MRKSAASSNASPSTRRDVPPVARRDDVGRSPDRQDTDEDNAMAIDIIFKGLERPRVMAEAVDQIISGHVFILQLAEVDRLVSAALQDSDMGERPTTSDGSNQRWQALAAALFDYGVEVADEDLFAIISGQLAPSAQLSNDIQRLNDKGYSPSLLRNVGPRVPLRQRINPFRGLLQTSGKGMAATGTKLYLQDQTRFSKKRAISVDNLERLRDKEMKAQKVKERREREQQQKVVEEKKSHDSAPAQMAAAEDTSFSGDPKLSAEKAKRTELLRQLERLETTYTNDERLLAKLKREQAQDSPRRVMPMASPLAATSHAIAGLGEKRGNLSPVRLREPTSVPFAAAAPKRGAKPGAKAASPSGARAKR